jgi:hypothetical protein
VGVQLQKGKCFEGEKCAKNLRKDNNYHLINTIKGIKKLMCARVGTPHRNPVVGIGKDQVSVVLQNEVVRRGLPYFGVCLEQMG